MRYNNDDDFILKLKLKTPNDELFIIKGNSQKTAEEIAQLVTTTISENGVVTEADRFAMPVVGLDIDRNYSELVQAVIRSGMLQGYSIKYMQEKVKFRLDEAGAGVEAEAVIVATKSLPKKLVMDRPFWIVMKQPGKKPYLILQVNNANIMIKK